jgi:hypothetical protein
MTKGGFGFGLVNKIIVTIDRMVEEVVMRVGKGDAKAGAGGMRLRRLEWRVRGGKKRRRRGEKVLLEELGQIDRFRWVLLVEVLGRRGGDDEAWLEEGRE